MRPRLFTVSAFLGGVALLAVLAPGGGQPTAARAQLAAAATSTPTPTATPCAGPGGLVIEPPFCGVYSATDLGAVPGLPPSYGGLTFLTGDPDTLLIGGNANTAPGELYSITVVRDSDDHVIGFSGTATIFAEAAYNDGGVAYGPDDVLFLARWPVNEVGQTRPGSATTDKIVSLGPLGVTASPGGLNFVPADFPGAGQLKIVTWSAGNWYSLDFTPDGTGTFDITAATLETQISGGPEGFIYVPPGSPLFSDFNSLLVSEYSVGSVAAYELDTGGNPLPTSRTTFIAGLTGAEGAVIDPLTGDFLFSTFGGGDRMIVVQGFAAPPPTPTSTPTETPTATQTPTPAPSATPTPGVHSVYLPVVLRSSSD